MIDQISLFEKSLFDDLKHIKSFRQNFESLPKVKKYLESEKYYEGPIANKMAAWGGDAELRKPWLEK